jgi:DNA transposition AAA+ family ATPase
MENNNSDTRALLLDMIQKRKGTAEELSNSKLAKKLGYSSSVISQYLDEEGNKYPGDIERLEHSISDFIRNELRRRASGVDTLECDAVDELKTALEYIRKTNDVGIVLSEAGVTKTRAVDFYRTKNPLSILFRARQWAKDEYSVQAGIFEAVKGGWDQHTKRVEHALNKLRGSDRLIIVDDAHKLNRSALQWFFDFHDETLCPIALVGIYDLEEKLADDAQRFSRVGLRWEIKPENPKALVDHLIKSLCPGITGPDARQVHALCEQVAEQHGHFRSVHKQLKLAAEIRESDTKKTWPTAVKEAHGMLVRKYPLN